MMRCEWAKSDLMIEYHDTEWGVPLYDDRKLFEFLVLEGVQAGLSWEIVLRKRENYRKAFHRFDPVKISKYTKKDINKLMKDAGIIRNKAKIDATVNNAKRFLEVKKEFSSFSDYMWQFVNNKPIKNKFKNLKELPAKTEISNAMSIDLKKRGFKFVGSTICYAHMQATGMVNDHLTSCFRHKEVHKLGMSNSIKNVR
ncbi:MAG TPA: DNA-3-methyladenine glycosylase I [Candidatus Aenigmarchaeota archaeon]|nr:DNA-3-methyladenine glycosylase I [Candidatus Aenigmarchaeota archaeon]